MSSIKRGDIFWVNLDPTVGSEIKKKRPAVIISNDIGNEVSKRVIIAPITSKASKIFPFEVPIFLKKKSGKILLDQLRAVDKIRLEEKISSCDVSIMDQINEALKVVLGLY
jgi:mRNA interferase MazF